MAGMRLLPVAAGALLLALPAGAQTIYRWIDAQGEEHFTDNPASIPPEYRKAARPMRGLETGQVSAPQSGAPASGPSAPRSPSGDEAQRRDQEAAREKRWREAFRAARERVETLESTLAADRAAVADPNAAGMPVRRLIDGTVLPSFEYEAAKQRVARNEAELAKAREALEDLDRSASREAVPQEWRR